MSLIAIRDAAIAFGEHPLLDGADLALAAGERVGLIGRNGTGKSTLLGILAGRIALDSGELQRRDGLRLALVGQEPTLPVTDTLIASLRLQARQDGNPAARLADDREEWRLNARLTEYLDRFGLSGERSPLTCSGGERKRAALALALAQQPDLLLLDEPTNHLDIDGITRLEELLQRVPAVLVITHDRTFLDHTVTRIVELDRGILRSYPGRFSDYETRKQEEMAAEVAARRRFDKFWKQEEAWIRQGVEARRTRNEGRVRRLERLRSERAARRDRLGSIRMSLDAGERSGELVAELDAIGKRFGERQVVGDLSLRILRGDRIGLIGANGAGKSTLIRLILGEIPPDTGTVRLGTRLKIAYFDQLREQLDPEWTLAEAISPGSDWVQVGEERKHVVSYLGEFLFSSQRASAPIRMLSGGERNRLLLARLFARPANLIVLDEPTNDLDIDSLELLEQRLQDYTGTLLLVSHDRRFLDNVVTQTLVAEGNGSWREYAGGYSDYLQQRSRAPAAQPAARAARPAAAPGLADAPAIAPARARLSYKEQRELDGLPLEIERLEQAQAELNATMSAGDYHRQGAERIRSDRKRLEELETRLKELYARWEVLEEQRSRASR